MNLDVSVPVTLFTPDPDDDVPLLTPDPDESAPVEKSAADALFAPVAKTVDAKAIDARTTAGAKAVDARTIGAKGAAAQHDDDGDVATTAFVRQSLTPDPDEEDWGAIAARARAAAAGTETAPVPKLEPTEIRGDKVTLVEGAATVVVQDTMTIDHTLRTAHVTSVQTATVSNAKPVDSGATTSSMEAGATQTTATATGAGAAQMKATDPRQAADAAASQAAAKAASSAKADGAPEQIDDEPSDGIVREIPTVETKPLRPPTVTDVPDDRPHDRTGEITASRKKQESTPPKNVEPSILIDDIGNAHAAVAAAAVAQVSAPKTADLATSADAAAVSQVRKDAVAAFTDAEEAFFKQGNEKEKETRFQMTGPVETFDDLDEDYRPVGFWDRLRGKKPKK